MRILVIEDNDYKFTGTEDYILKSFPDAKIDRATYAKEGFRLATTNEYEVIVVDMYMPINSDSSIDREAGFWVLNTLLRKKHEDVGKCVINSSEEKIGEILAGKEELRDVHFIHYSTCYDLTNKFKETIEKILFRGNK